MKAAASRILQGSSGSVQNGVWLPQISSSCLNACALISLGNFLSRFVPVLVKLQIIVPVCC